MVLNKAVVVPRTLTCKARSQSPFLHCYPVRRLTSNLRIRGMAMITR